MRQKQQGLGQQNGLRLMISALSIVGYSLMSMGLAIAQITPDATLTNPSSLSTNVLIKGILGDRLDGGMISGSSLLHSFSEFNIDAGQRVYFGNPDGIINILSRVTGNTGSNIFGTLGVDGNANLFLINPNGIVFGKDTTLDISGSFFGSTASELNLGNNSIINIASAKALDQANWKVEKLTQ